MALRSWKTLFKNYIIILFPPGIFKNIVNYVYIVKCLKYTVTRL